MIFISALEACKPIFSTAMCSMSPLRLSQLARVETTASTTKGGQNFSEGRQQHVSHSQNPVSVVFGPECGLTVGLQPFLRREVGCE